MAQAAAAQSRASVRRASAPAAPLEGLGGRLPALLGGTHPPLEERRQPGIVRAGPRTAGRCAAACSGRSAVEVHQHRLDVREHVVRCGESAAVTACDGSGKIARGPGQAGQA